MAQASGACMQGVEEVLRAIPYGTNEVYLHTDARLMARNRQAWASWNFIGAMGNPETTPVCVTYWVNRLQRVPADAPETFVTLNPACPPAQEKTALHAQLAHPVFSFASLHAQEQLPHVQVGSVDANALQGLVVHHLQVVHKGLGPSSGPYLDPIASEGRSNDVPVTNNTHSFLISHRANPKAEAMVGAEVGQPKIVAKTEPILELGSRCIKAASDLDVGLMTQLEEALQKEWMAGLDGYERGEACYNLHAPCDSSAWQKCHFSHIPSENLFGLE